MTKVQIGLERLVEMSSVATGEMVKGAAISSLLRGAPFGLLMNQASVDSRFHYACDVLAKRFPGQLKVLLAPQHGLWGEQQANMIESQHGLYPKLNLPVYSLYAQTREPTPAMLDGIELLVVDLQDVGTRVYTFIWTIVNCLRVCRAMDMPVLLLDRPNPIGGVVVEGLTLKTEYRSFVGLANIPMRHGLTLGELAQFCNSELDIRADLNVLPLLGWQRSFHWPQCGLPWCAPSPNMPRYETTLVYPGQVLLEGTNLSEGRGTTLPFELVGAPYVDETELSNRLNRKGLPGVVFRPIRFVPTFDKWCGQSCGGVYLHVTDPQTFRSYSTTVHILYETKQLHPEHFAWLPPPYEYEYHKPPIDILSGDDSLRSAIDQLNFTALSPHLQTGQAM